MEASEKQDHILQAKIKNNYNSFEIAGAFGDLGTLVPFVLVYITILRFDPAGVLLTFGIANIVIGAFYKTPIPVQPMKAIGTFAATHASQVSTGMVAGAGLFTGLFWLVMALTGMVTYIQKFIQRPVLKGILLGLGLSFILEGLKYMAQQYVLASAGIILFFLLQKFKKIPALLLVLLLGVGVKIIAEPNLLQDLISIRPDLHWPKVILAPFALNELVKGIFILALPQIPLTLGNGVIALTGENNQLFPTRPVTTRKVAISTGLLNVFSPFLGGVPMCHGAGGIAGHVRFGARTGGATVILGGIFLILALFFSESLTFIFSLFPVAILGVIMFLAGTGLANSAYYREINQEGFYLMIITAGVGLYNAGLALLVGIVLSFGFQKINNQNGGF